MRGGFEQFEIFLRGRAGVSCDCRRVVAGRGRPPEEDGGARGEGAGYAGGIVSAAVDGIKVGRAILQKE